MNGRTILPIVSKKVEPGDSKPFIKLYSSNIGRPAENDSGGNTRSHIPHVDHIPTNALQSNSRYFPSAWNLPDTPAVIAGCLEGSICESWLWGRIQIKIGALNE